MRRTKQWPKILPFLAVILLLMGWVNQAESQEKYPTRAIDIIVATGPGGSLDLDARITAEFLKRKWRVPINIINKPGGSSVIGNTEVYQAAPDGYTILADCQSSCSMLEVSIQNLPFKIMDRTFIAMLAEALSVFYVPVKYPWKTLKEIEAEIKRNPGEFTWTSMGGGGGDYAIRQFFKAIQVDLSKTKPVMCRGGAEAASMTAGGNVKLGISSATTAYPTVQAGMTRAVAITGRRMSEFPDLPTTAEQGYPSVDQVWWFGFSGPPKLPAHIVDKWNEAAQEIVKDKEFDAKLKNVLCVPRYRNAAETREQVKKEMEDAQKLWGVK